MGTREPLYPEHLTRILAHEVPHVVLADLLEQFRRAELAPPFEQIHWSIKSTQVSIIYAGFWRGGGREWWAIKEIEIR